MLGLCILTIHSRRIIQDLSDHIGKEEFYNSDIQSKIKIASYAVNNSLGNSYQRLYPDYESETLEDVIKERSHLICDMTYNRQPRTNLISMQDKCSITHKTDSQNAHLVNSNAIDVIAQDNMGKLLNENRSNQTIGAPILGLSKNSSIANEHNSLSEQFHKSEILFPTVYKTSNTPLIPIYGPTFPNNRHNQMQFLATVVGFEKTSSKNFNGNPMVNTGFLRDDLSDSKTMPSINLFLNHFLNKKAEELANYHTTVHNTDQMISLHNSNLNNETTMTSPESHKIIGKYNSSFTTTEETLSSPIFQNQTIQNNNVQALNPSTSYLKKDVKEVLSRKANFEQFNKQLNQRTNYFDEPYSLEKNRIKRNISFKEHNVASSHSPNQTISNLLKNTKDASNELSRNSQDVALQPKSELYGAGISTLNNHSLDKQHKQENRNKEILSALLELLFQNLERPKRKSGKKIHPGMLPGYYKYSRRSVAEKNPDFEMYSSKLQKMKKELSDLEKALSAPKSSHGKNDDRNLTLQIRVIVDVVNNTFKQNDTPDEEQLKKRDTALLQKNVNVGNIVPLPLDRDSPLKEEDNKANNVEKHIRVGSPEIGRNISKREWKGSENADTKNYIIQNITNLLDTLLENRDLIQNKEGKKKCLLIPFPEPKKSDGSQSFIFKTKKPVRIGESMDYAVVTSTEKQFLCELVTARKCLYNESVDDYAVSRYLSHIAEDDETTTQISKNEILIEFNDGQVGRLYSNRVANRVRRNLMDKDQLLMKQVENKSLADFTFEDEIKGLNQIINSIKKKLAFNNANDTIFLKEKINNNSIERTFKSKTTDVNENEPTRTSAFIEFHRPKPIKTNNRKNKITKKNQKFHSAEFYNKEYEKLTSYQSAENSDTNSDIKETLGIPLSLKKGVFREKSQINGDRKISELEIETESKDFHHKTKPPFSGLNTVHIDIIAPDITIDWCCMGSEDVSDSSSSEPTTSSAPTTKKMTNLGKKGPRLLTTLTVETKKNVHINTAVPRTTCFRKKHSSTITSTKKVRVRGDHCHYHHHKNHSLFKEHKLNSMTTCSSTTVDSNKRTRYTGKSLKQMPTSKKKKCRHHKTETPQIVSCGAHFRDLVEKNIDGVCKYIENAILLSDKSKNVIKSRLRRN